MTVKLLVKMFSGEVELHSFGLKNLTIAALDKIMTDYSSMPNVKSVEIVEWNIK